jgi:hypothetical protein
VGDARATAIIAKPREKELGYMRPEKYFRNPWMSTNKKMLRDTPAALIDGRMTNPPALPNDRRPIVISVSFNPRIPRKILKDEN